MTLETDQNVSGAKNFAKINNIRFADQFGGADAGAKIAAAIAALPSTGGTVDARGLEGAQTSASNPFSSVTKPVRLLLGHSNISSSVSWSLTGCHLIEGSPAGGTTLTFTPSAGTAISFDCSQSHNYGFGISNLALVGSGGTSVGLSIGGSTGAEGFASRNLKISGFGTNLSIGSNTWAVTFDHLLSIGAVTKALDIPGGTSNSGEGILFLNSFFARSGAYQTDAVTIAASGLSSVSFIGGGFDNCQFHQSAGNVIMTNVHFENPGVETTSDFLVQDGGTLTINSSDFLQAVTGAASLPSRFLVLNAGTMILRDVGFASNTASMANAIRTTGGTLRESGTRDNTNVTGFVSNGGGTIRTLQNIYGNNVLNGALNVASNVNLKRLTANQAAALVAGDFALSAGWGTTASVGTVIGTDAGWTITVTSSGTGQGASPTITLTFKDGTWTSAPICITKMTGGTGTFTNLTEAPTATTNVITFGGTPVAGSTYTISSIAMGR